jgi:hypothetical protein
LQRVDDLAIKILPERLIGNVECFQAVGTHLQGRAVEVEYEIAVFIEQDGVPGSRPNLDAGRAIAELGAEDAGTTITGVESAASVPMR